MAVPNKKLFLERRSYRRRRIGDAIKLLPFFGAILFILPVFWGSGDAPARTSTTGLYVFCVWGGLVAGLIVMTRLRGKAVSTTPETLLSREPEE